MTGARRAVRRSSRRGRAAGASRRRARADRLVRPAAAADVLRAHPSADDGNDARRRVHAGGIDAAVLGARVARRWCTRSCIGVFALVTTPVTYLLLVRAAIHRDERSVEDAATTPARAAMPRRTDADRAHDTSLRADTSTSEEPSAITMFVVLPRNNSSTALRPCLPITIRSQSCSCSSRTIASHGSKPAGVKAVHRPRQGPRVRRAPPALAALVVRAAELIDPRGRRRRRAADVPRRASRRNGSARNAHPARQPSQCRAKARSSGKSRLERAHDDTGREPVACTINTGRADFLTTRSAVEPIR